MTLAKQLTAIVDINFDGSLRQSVRGTPTSVEATLALVRHLVDEGVDEIWLRPTLGKCKSPVLQELLTQIQAIAFMPLGVWLKPKHRLGEYRVDTEAEKVVVNVAELDGIDLIEQAQRFVGAAGPDRVVALLSVQRVPEVAQRWELLTQLGKSSHTDVLTLVHGLVDAGVAQIALRTQTPKVDVELLDAISATLPIGVTLFCSDLNDETLQTAFIAGAENLALISPQNLPPLAIAKAKGFAMMQGFAIRPTLASPSVASLNQMN